MSKNPHVGRVVFAQNYGRGKATSDKQIDRAAAVLRKAKTPKK